jgi:hypothetical protein
MIAMVEMSPGAARRMGLAMPPGLLLIGWIYEFVSLVVAYRVVAAIAPDLLGAVAGSPVRFAAWVALISVPLSAVCMLAASWRIWVALIVRGEVLEPPVRTGWRRVLATVGGGAAALTCSVLAALIVFAYVADPGVARLWPLVAVTAAGPFLLPRLVSGAFRLLRRWRHRRSRSAPDDQGGPGVNRAHPDAVSAGG